MNQTYGRQVLWPAEKERRDLRKAQGVCINGGPKSRVEHGPVVQGGKCQRCIDVWRKSK